MHLLRATRLDVTDVCLAVVEKGWRSPSDRSDGRDMGIRDPFGNNLRIEMTA